MLVTLDASSPEGFRVHSFAGDDWQICRDYVRPSLGLPTFESGGIPSAKDDVVRQTSAPDEPIKEAKQKSAAAIWRETEAVRSDTPADRYLMSRLNHSRLLDVLDESGQVRFHEYPYFDAARFGSSAGNSEMPFAGSAGAIVCRMTDPATGDFVGIHRTFITLQGRKIERRMLGGSGVVQIIGNGSHPELHLGEGLENTLAVLLRYDRFPIWATLNAGNMAKFPVLEDVRRLSLFVDNDPIKNGRRAGSDAAERCAQTWLASGHSVESFLPPDEGADFADIQLGRKDD